MAEVTGLRNNALPYPVYGVPFGVTFPLLDADGDPVSPSSPDSEISKNGDTFADCTNEATEIATSSGICYLLLTGTELTCDVATIQAKSTGAKTTVMTLYPRKLVTIRANTSASGGASTSTIVLDGSASAVDDAYNGMLCVAVIDGTTEARIISDYTGSTQTATVVPDWNTAPDNNDTFTIYLPEGVQINQANVTHAASTAWNSGAIGANTLASDTIAAAKIASGAITNAKFAAGAIDAAAIAADAIGASELAADAVAEIQSGLSTLTAAGVRSAVGLASANLDTQLAAVQADTDDIQTRLPAALVGGRMDGSVGAMAANVMTAAAAAADLTTELQSGLATAAALSTTDGKVDGIKAKTDSLTFTVAGQVDANIQRINDVAIVGDGSGTPFNV